MTLLPEWKKIATSAWSFLGSITNALFLAAAAGWESFAPYDLHLDTTTYLAIGSILAAVTGASRLVQQDKLAKAIASYLAEQSGAVSKKAAAGIMAAVLAVGVPITAKWEGKVNNAHFDQFAKIYDICYGNTRIEGRAVKPGDYRTDAQCTEYLKSDWGRFYAEMRKAFPNLINAPVTVQAAAVDLAYNNGTAAVVSARTTGKYLRTGQWRAFCNILPQWNKSGGSFVQGLLNRRNDVRVLCLSGLK